MNEQLPDQPNLNPDQAELFDSAQYDPELQAKINAEKQARVEAVYQSAFNESESTDKPKQTKPMSMEDREATSEALSQLTDSEGILPESVKLKRDWKDSLAEHNAKQKIKNEAAAKILQARLEKDEKLSGTRTRQAEKRRIASEQKAADKARAEKNAQIKSQKEGDDQKRAELRAEYIAKQKLLLGSIAFERTFKDEVERDADNYAADFFRSNDPTTGTVLDTDELKNQRREDEKSGKVSPSQDKNQETRRLAEEFQRGFNQESSEQDTSNREASEDQVLDAEAEAKKEANLGRLGMLTQRVEKAREEYARAVAVREQKTIGVNSKEAINKAWINMKNISEQLIALEKDMALEAGVSKELLEQWSHVFGVGDNERITTDLYLQRHLATGDYKLVKTSERDENGDVTSIEELAEIVPTTKLGKLKSKFYKWWGKQQDQKLLSLATVKKAVVMGGAGALVGVPAAVAGGIILGPAIGGAFGALIATRIAKGVMSNHMSRRSKGIKHVERLHKDLEQRIDAGIDNPDLVNGFEYMVKGQTENEVHHNRRRVLASFAAAAIGGAAGAAGIEHIFSGGSGHEVQTTHAHTSNHGSTHHSHHHTQNHELKYHTESLTHSGDTISNEVASYLGEHGYEVNDSTIQKVTQATLHESGISWAQARDLPVGYNFRIPTPILEQISRVK